MKPSLFPIIGFMAFNCRFLSKELGYDIDMKKFKLENSHIPKQKKDWKLFQNVNNGLKSNFYKK